MWLSHPRNDTDQFNSLYFLPFSYAKTQGVNRHTRYDFKTFELTFLLNLQNDVVWFCSLVRKKKQNNPLPIILYRLNSWLLYYNTNYYGHLPPITKTTKVRRTRHAGHCWRSRDELISDVFKWTPSHVWAKAGQPARAYIQQLCEDTRCSPEDLPEAMNDREE